ncbi:MAG: 1-deoxy-D-xylulose-5-phosphate synthase [Bacteroidetes bacterium]|nr:MAG: 1-deoxy-D-xylulose-5-phosphate synthase [Bacteroidota bacterium]
MPEQYALLQHIQSPADVRKLGREQLTQLCDELRAFIVDKVSKNGGHFAANLGVIELTVALHHVLNTPTDKLIWDVGHQAYGHKILTGRRDQFDSNRRKGGLAGFPKMSESEYDAFGTGHSSTSISAALGMAVSAQLKGDLKRQHVAVIGDGAMTAGLAFEGLNHAGSLNTNLLVVLNDNSMSIDPNVGALKNYLAALAHSERRNSFRDEVLHMLKQARQGGLEEELLRKLESSATQLMGKDINFFESLNFHYFGPVDGHDVVGLSTMLQRLVQLPGPKLLHVLTLKGKGYDPAEKEQTLWHAPGLFDKLSGELKKGISDAEAPKFQDVFGHTLLELALKDEKIVGITPAMPSGCSMNIMMEQLPERVFDVGIAEQHAVTFSAGLASDGLTPFCNLYSTFAQRAYDQIIHDVCVQQLSVVFCLDRAGLVGEDGPTHHGAFDMAFLRCLPNMVVSAPSDEAELRNLMYTASQYKDGAFSIRYPRGRGQELNWRNKLTSLEIGKGLQTRKGKGIAILYLGTIGQEALKAIDLIAEEGIEVSAYNMLFLKPLDLDLLDEAASEHSTLITLEDGCLEGGFGSAVLEGLYDLGHRNEVIRIGIPDQFMEHASPQELYKMCGMDSDSILSLLRHLSA